MKILLNLCCGASIAFVIALAMGRTSKSIASTPLPSARDHIRLASHTLKQDDLPLGHKTRTKVVQYFATYEADPLGLPPVCASRAMDGDIPTDWKITGVSRGESIPEAQRAALIEIPAELVKVLPKDKATVRYYLAGSHLVALNEGYKVLDTLPIPTVRLSDNSLTDRSVQSRLVRHIQHPGNSR